MYATSVICRLYTPSYLAMTLALPDLPPIVVALSILSAGHLQSANLLIYFWMHWVSSRTGGFDT